MDGVVVFSGTLTSNASSEGEAEINWEEIARVTRSPFIDTRQSSTSKPETVYYKLQYMKNDKLVGMESTIIKVVRPGSDLASKVK